MPEQKKQPPLQTYTLEIPALDEVFREQEKLDDKPKLVKPLEDTVNEDLIRRLIYRLKRI